LNDLEHQNRGFYGFYICSQWAFIHALLSRVPFALAGLSCSAWTRRTLIVDALPQGHHFVSALRVVPFVNEPVMLGMNEDIETIDVTILNAACLSLAYSRLSWIRPPGLRFISAT